MDQEKRLMDQEEREEEEAVYPAGGVGRSILGYMPPPLPYPGYTSPLYPLHAQHGYVISVLTVREGMLLGSTLRLIMKKRGLRLPGPFSL